MWPGALRLSEPSGNRPRGWCPVGIFGCGRGHRPVREGIRVRPVAGRIPSYTWRGRDGEACERSGPGQDVSLLTQPRTGPDPDRTYPFSHSIPGDLLARPPVSSLVKTPGARTLWSPSRPCVRRDTSCDGPQTYPFFHRFLGGPLPARPRVRGSGPYGVHPDLV